MHNFILIGGTYIRTSAITKVGNSEGISNCHIYTSDGTMHLTELSVDEVMELISKSEARPKPNFGRHGEPQWRHRS